MFKEKIQRQILLYAAGTLSVLKIYKCNEFHGV